MAKHVSTLIPWSRKFTLFWIGLDILSYIDGLFNHNRPELSARVLHIPINRKSSVLSRVDHRQDSSSLTTAQIDLNISFHDKLVKTKTNILSFPLTTATDGHFVFYNIS